MIIFEAWEAEAMDEDHRSRGVGSSPTEAIKNAVNHIGGITVWSPNVTFKIRRLHNGSDGGWVACSQKGEYGNPRA
jgi:hypothetical protein